MKTEIKTQNVIRDRKKCKKIVSISGILKWSELPAEYISTSNSFYWLHADNTSRFTLLDREVFGEGSYIDRGVFTVGDIISEELFLKTIDSMKKAAQRLSDFNSFKGWKDKKEVYTI
jgi:hypothetical protein